MVTELMSLTRADHLTFFLAALLFELALFTLWLVLLLRKGRAKLKEDEYSREKRQKKEEIAEAQVKREVKKQQKKEARQNPDGSQKPKRGKKKKTPKFVFVGDNDGAKQDTDAQIEGKNGDKHVGGERENGDQRDDAPETSEQPSGAEGGDK